MIGWSYDKADHSKIFAGSARACRAGMPFLGKETATGAAAYFGFEDPDGVLLHRQSRINDLLGIPHPKDLYIKSYLGRHRIRSGHARMGAIVLPNVQNQY